jgi:maltoporin
MMTGSFLLLAVLASGSAVASDFEYHGYMRSGIGFSRGGTDQVCFKAPKAAYKARLGNECETYIETNFVKVHGDKESAYFTSNVNVALVSSAHRDWEPTTAEFNPGTSSNSQAFTLSLREAYASGHNLFSKGGMSAWVGKRFYKRHDLHMFDYYIIDNTGPGAGVENIDAGFSKVHFAVLRNIPNSADGPAQTNLDLRLSDIKAGPGSLETILIHGTAGTRGHDSGVEKWEAISGNQLALIYGYNLLGGSNKIVLQYGQGIFGGSAAGRESTLNAWGGWGSQEIGKGDSTTLDSRKKSSTIRLSEQLVTNGETFSSESVLIYQSTSFGDAKDAAGSKVKDLKELTVGTRPIYHLNKNAAIALEYAYTNITDAIAPTVANNEWNDATLHKITLAPQLTADKGYWSRPQIRLFTTYAMWNKEANAASGGVYGKDKSGFTTGAQLESWW